ncbi:MAG: Cna B-type domain-containing protein, partial [Atopobiaceae bacterium]|nr:Cna B-type domain-containing protein [Atopobiaceae bacterium]
MEKKGSRVLAAVLAVVLAIGAAVGLTSIARATTATTVKSKYASETGDIQIGDGTAYKWIELTTNFEDGTSTKEKVFCADIFATFPAAEGDEVHHTDYKTKTEEFTGNDLVRAILYVGYENDKAGISQWIADDNYIGAPYTSLKYGTLWTASGADRVPDDQKDSFFYISTQAAIYRALHGNSGLNRLDYDDYYINCGAFQATRDYIYNTAQDYLDQGSIPADFKVEKHESVDGDHQVLIKAKTGTDSAEEKPAITNTTAKVGDKAATASEAAKPTIAEGADLVISDDVEFSNLADGKTYQIVSELWSNGSVQKTATQYVTSATQSPVTITFDAVRPANGQTFNIKTSLMLDGQEVAVHNSDRNLSNEQVVVTVDESDGKGSLLIKKVDENGNKLAGAHLQLKQGDDVVKDLPNFSGEEGVYELEPGEYTLVEVEAPTRYETADPITVTVKKDTYQVNFATNAGGLGQFNVYQNGSVIGTAFCVNPNKDIPGTTPVDYKPMFDVDYDNIGITTSEGKNDARKLQVQRILTAFNDKADELKQMLGTASQPDAGLNLATAYAIETLLGGEPETPSTNFTTGDIMAVVDYLKGTIAVRGEIKYTFVYLKPNTTTSSQDVVVAVPYEGAITMTDLPKPSIVSTTAKAGGKNATSSAAAAPTVAAGETLVITDDVTLSNVTGEDYTVVADLWSNGSIQQTKEIAVPNGANSVTVTFDAVTPTNNQQFNVAAKLVKDGETVAEHNQNRQTVSERVIVTVEEQPEITNTTAKAGGKTATATDSAKPTVAKGQDLVISDVVEFAKLGDGEYTVEAELWSKGAVRQTKTATVTKADSSVEIAFDGVKPENGQEYNIVAKLKKGNDVVATHNSERNTVSERVNVTVESVKVKATKVWSDANNQDGIRPASVTIKLLADGTDTGRTVTLDESNEWKATFADL